jgi:hypothetical protein
MADLGAGLRALLDAGLTQGEVLAILGERTADSDAEAIQSARDNWADDDLEIDDTPCTSRADDGCWVAAWVWVADE